MLPLCWDCNFKQFAYLYQVKTQLECERYVVQAQKGLSSRSKNMIRAQFKRRRRSARVAVRVIETFWERDGRSKNLQGKEPRNANNAEFDHVLTVSLKKITTQRGFRGLRLV
jgi:hypothetical protein